MAQRQVLGAKCEMGRSRRPIGQRALTCLAQVDWTVDLPVPGGLFDFSDVARRRGVSAVVGGQRQ